MGDDGGRSLPPAVARLCARAAIVRSIENCDAEIARAEASLSQNPHLPLIGVLDGQKEKRFLPLLGWMDWTTERRILLEELETACTPAKRCKNCATANN